MNQQHVALPKYQPDYHLAPGTTVDFANRIVTGTCYDFEPGEELQCPRCGSTETTRISPAGGPVRCNDGSVARDAGVMKCQECHYGYIWRFCGD